MILIVAPEDDLHACVVAERLRARGSDVFILNTTWFPWRHRISWSTEQGSAKITGAAAIDLSAVSTVWWRRFRQPTPDPCITDPHVKRFSVSESAHALRGIFASLAIPVINDPGAERHASLKLVQLHLAKKVGLAVPRTIVSNDRGAVLDFIRSCEHAICKTIVCDYPHNILTRTCVASEFESERDVSLSPIIVQERVDASLDIRATIVDSLVFAGELERSDINENVDCRATASGWRRHTLPLAIQEQLLDLASSLGLTTGSVDMRLAQDGRYVFLEMNPSGQFLFLEVDAGLPISEAFADLLVSGQKRVVQFRQYQTIPLMPPPRI
jgi:glutathione synthase/RimK-type ligase-like ATP-grasp enzyme